MRRLIMPLPRTLNALRVSLMPVDMAISVQRLRTCLVVCALVLLVGLSLTAVGVWRVQLNTEREARVNFDRYVDKLDADIEARFARVLYRLRGLRSYYAASVGPVTRDAFRIWVAARGEDDGLQGVRGVGFIQRVERADLNAFVDAERADNAPGFAVRTSGSASDLYVIKYIEPLANNEKAWGFDVGSEPTRRAAAELAVSTGKPALTARITLVQDGKKRPGYLYFVPVFKWASKIDTPADRRQNLVGLLYSPIVVEEFLSGIAQVTDGQVDVDFYDGDGISEDSKVFDLDLMDEPREFKGAFESTKKLLVGRHSLTLRASSGPDFERRFVGHGAWWLAFVGSVLSVLLTVTIWLLLIGRARAEAMATRMTADLSSAKQRAEQALRDNTALLDTLHRYNLMSAADKSGKIIDANDAFCRISGYARDELIGHPHSIVNSGEHPRAFWADMWRTISHGEAWEGEVCNRAKDGELYWVKSIILPMLGADGAVEKYISIRTDITANKRNEEALHAMAERYQMAIDGGNDGLWDWLNVNDHKMWWSPQFYRMLGYEPDEFPAGLDAFESLLHPDNQREVIKTIEGALKKYRPLDAICRAMTKSGQYRWLRVRGKVFFDEAGFATRMAGSIQDVHDRQMAEEVIQKHSEQLSAIFSLSPDGFVSFGADGQVNYASAAYSKLTGLASEAVLCLNEAEFLSQLWGQCVNPPSIESLHALMQVRPDADPLSWMGRHKLVIEMKEPAGRMLALSLYEAQGESVSRLLLVSDVTNDAEVDRMKSAFLSMAAHELRTPMASIYGFVELLLTREIKPEKQKDLLGKIFRQCEVMISIINELLDLARIENKGRADFDSEECDLVKLVNEVVHDFKPPNDRGAPVITRPTGPMAAQVDRQKMCQAILNVLSNAYKYSPQGGQVEVSFPTRTGDDGAMWGGVQVVDSGIGMSEEQLAHMGERFFRADKSGNIPGTGLGVSIVKQIMDLMGGQLEVTSELNKGTTMTLWMPVVTSKQLAWNI
jgi:PAS domain S-box-containing protein